MSLKKVDKPEPEEKETPREAHARQLRERVSTINAPKRVKLAKLDAALSARTGSVAMEDYKAVLAARKEAFAEHVEGMIVDPSIVAWAERMTQRFGPICKVWHNELPWIEALLVVRYGEAIDFWPAATTIADYGRAQDWESGAEMPYAVIQAKTMHLNGEGS